MNPFSNPFSTKCTHFYRNLQCVYHQVLLSSHQNYGTYNNLYLDIRIIVRIITNYSSMKGQFVRFSQLGLRLNYHT